MANIKTNCLAFLLLVLVCHPVHAAKVFFASDCLEINQWCMEGNLTAYIFEEGVLKNKEEYFKYRRSEYDPFPFNSIGDNHIIQNRYIVSGERIYDLKQRKIIHDGYQYSHIYYREGNRQMYVGRFVKVIDDKVIYSGTERSTVEGEEDQGNVYVYDLNKHEYKKAENMQHWLLPGNFSPDFQKTIMARPVKKGWGIGLFTVEGANLLIEGLETSPFNNHFPMVWFDSHTILTQRKDGELITIDINSSKITDIMTITFEESDKKWIHTALYKDESNKFFYRYNRQQFEIDVENKTYKKDTRKWVEIGHGFQIENKGEPNALKKIGYNGSIIGEYKIDKIEVTDEHMAIVYLEKKPYGHKPNIAIWTEQSNRWVEYEMDFLQAFIGWIEQP